MSIFPNIDRINLIGIDPGTHHCGISVLSIHPYTHAVLGIEAFSLNLDKLVINDPYYQNYKDQSPAKFIVYRNHLLDVFNRYRPSVVGCESPFFHRLHPSAFAPLASIMSYSKEACFLFNPTVKFIEYPPMIVKRAIASSKADKADMRVALSKFKAFPIDIALLSSVDEHAVDACAVNACLYKSLILKESI